MDWLVLETLLAGLMTAECTPPVGAFAKMRKEEKE
jgi:hypothetical protein